jgi:sugar phosphate permease
LEYSHTHEDQLKAAAEKPTRQREMLVVILLFTIVVAYLDRVNVAVLLADSQFLADMGIQGKPVQMGMLMTAFLAAYGIGNVFFSPLGDILGPRKAISLSVILWAPAMIAGGLSGSFAVLLGSRIFLGACEGMHWPMQSKYVKNWFPPHERGKANAVWLVGLMLGPAAAMPFFSWLIPLSGWRDSFFVLALLSLLPVYCLWCKTRDYAWQHSGVNRAELNQIEAGLKAEQEREAAAGRQGLWASAKVFIGDYQFWLLTVFSFCHASMWWGTMAWLPSYLKMDRGFSWQALGAAASVPYLLGILAGLGSGFWSDRTGRRAPFAAVSVLGAAAGIYFGLRVTDNLATVALLSLGIVFLAVGLSSVYAIL